MLRGGVIFARATYTSVHDKGGMEGRTTRTDRHSLDYGYGHEAGKNRMENSLLFFSFFPFFVFEGNESLWRQKRLTYSNDEGNLPSLIPS